MIEMITAAERINITVLAGTEIARPRAVAAAGACSVLVIVMKRITRERETPCSVWITHWLAATASGNSSIIPTVHRAAATAETWPPDDYERV
jgi:hypothetical protein